MHERPLNSPKATVRFAEGTFEIASLIFSNIGENVKVNDEGYETSYRSCKHLVQ